MEQTAENGGRAIRGTLLEKSQRQVISKKGEEEKCLKTGDSEEQGDVTEGGDGHSMGVKHPTTVVWLGSRFETAVLRFAGQTDRFWETLFHLIKGNIGSGMFAMGDAFKNAGLLLAPFLTIFLGVICVYGNHVLIKCSKELAKRRNLPNYPSFPDTMEWAFQSGPKVFQRFSGTMRFLVKLFNIIAQLGFCSVYFVFISSTLNKLILKWFDYDLDKHILMALILVPMVSTVMVRSLKFLVPFSVIATNLIFLGVMLTMAISMQDMPPVSSRFAVASWSQLPLFFGTAIYCFEGIGLVMPLQCDMKHPEKFASTFGVLNLGMTLVGAVLVWMGFVGYLKYGEDVAGSLTLNLPNNWFSDCVQLLIALGLFFSYALQFHVAVCYVWPDLKQKHGPFKNPFLAEYGVRVGLALITFVAAEVVPQLGLFISLLGSVSSTALALVFPPLCDLALHWGRNPGPQYIFDGISLLLACVGFCTGSFISLQAIIAAFFSPT